MPCLIKINSAVPPLISLASSSFARILQASSIDRGSTMLKRRISHLELGVLEYWSVGVISRISHHSITPNHFIAPFLLLFLCCGPQHANGRRLQPFGAALL